MHEPDIGRLADTYAKIAHQDAIDPITPTPRDQLPTSPAPDYSANYADRYRITPCSRCHAPMIFVSTAKGGTMPIDPVPLDPRPTEHRRGLVVFEGPERVRTLTKSTPPQHNQPVYTSHFSTCPFAAEFRS